MATATGEALEPAPGAETGGIAAFLQTPNGRNIALSVGAALAVAVLVAAWMWAQKPEYKVLFANFSDRDGGAIVASLQQQNIPYKFSDGGGAILVPADQVYDARLKLAAQGLPKGGNVGFEIMENQKLGVSQFLEQVNYQRALEGELANSIQSLAAVQAARVHLAIPKASVFMRDQQKPTASVLLNLAQGRSLDEAQVSAIVHLVASSVPDLTAKNVTVVDQNGDLLSSADKMAGANGLDPNQLKYVQELQHNIVTRVESIVAPIVGAPNVRAEATADVDFSHTEQAAETYKPNQPPNEAAVRSLQTSESTNGNGNGASGVPGALTNQPPAPATAQINGAPAQNAPAPSTPTSSHKDSTTNYEVDKTVRYVQQPMGGLKRLSVAVVVNYKREVDKSGKVTMRPLSEDEKTQITNLVKEAMGYSKDRGDTLNVVNTSFAGADSASDNAPWWQKILDGILANWSEILKAAAKWLVFAIVFLYCYRNFIKPALNKAKETVNPTPAAHEHGAEEGEEDAIVELSNEPVPMGQTAPVYRNNLEAAKALAKQDPKMVATIIKGWVGVPNE
ncbi:MAG TPA: flagellar basal-body MS-ring/collar protein FliF [Burkholderiaceae bacterium]